MTQERLDQLTDWVNSGGTITTQDVRECLDEIERLDNITLVQQKQIERLIAARDAERVKVAELTKALSHYRNG